MQKTLSSFFWITVTFFLGLVGWLMLTVGSVGRQRMLSRFMRQSNERNARRALKLIRKSAYSTAYAQYTWLTVLGIIEYGWFFWLKTYS